MFETQRITDTQATVQQLKDTIRQFVEERSWQRFHNLKNLSMALSIEAAELMEHTQWMTTQQVVTADFKGHTEVAEEVADILSYTLAIANALDIDLTTTLLSKMIKNRLKYPIGAERTLQARPTEHDAFD